MARLSFRTNRGSEPATFVNLPLRNARSGKPFPLSRPLDHIDLPFFKMLFSTSTMWKLTIAPRAHLFTVRRSFASASARRVSDFSNPFSGPAPPKLPKEEQDIFEDLQRQSTGAFSSSRTPPKINQSPDSTPAEAAQAQGTVEARAEALADSREGDPSASTSQGFEDAYRREIEARGKGEELHPNMRRGAPPEFEGDVNPRTGEVGGPKNEPLRWGADGEWSYNGRTTDF